MAMQARADGVLCLARQREKPSKSDRAQASMTMGIKMSGSRGGLPQMAESESSYAGLYWPQQRPSSRYGKRCTLSNAGSVPSPPRDVGNMPYVWMHNSIWSGFSRN